MPQQLILLLLQSVRFHIYVDVKCISLTNSTKAGVDLGQSLSKFQSPICMKFESHIIPLKLSVGFYPL